MRITPQPVCTHWQVFNVSSGLAGMVRESFWNVGGDPAVVRLRSAVLRMPHSGKRRASWGRVAKGLG